MRRALNNAQLSVWLFSVYDKLAIIDLAIYMFNCQHKMIFDWTETKNNRYQVIGLREADGGC